MVSRNERKRGSKITTNSQLWLWKRNALYAVQDLQQTEQCEVCVCVWECVCVCVCSPVFITEAWDLLSLQENMFLQPVSEEWVLEQLDLQATRLV